jgi:FkbM family methyltransferase
MLTRAGLAVRAVRNLGVGPTVRFLGNRALAAVGLRPAGYYLTARTAAWPLFVRSGTSDPVVFRQIFIDREYACLDHLTGVGLVIDCGANVGYSSAYFLSRFPGCRVMAVEPDPDNFRSLQRNLAPYGDRATAIRAGVWSRPARLTLRPGGYRGGDHWARQVAETTADDPNGFDAVDVGTLLAWSGADRISVLKVDIEGAEAEVFARNYEGWLDRVEALVIELHDDTVFGPATPVFDRAVAGRPVRRSRFEELTVLIQDRAHPVL